jgi:lysozyme
MFRSSDDIQNQIMRWEGVRLEAYQDTGGIWTVGYGHTGAGVRAGTRWTPQQARNVFKLDIAQLDHKLNLILPGMGLHSLFQHQYDGIVAFTYNCGVETLSPTYNGHGNGYRFLATKQFESFANWMTEFVHDQKGHELPGLVARREFEKKIFLGLADYGPSGIQSTSA